MSRYKIGFDAKRLFENNTGLGNFSRSLVLELQKKYPQHEYHLFAPNLIRNANTEPFFENEKFVLHSNETIFPNAFWRISGMASLANNIGLNIFHGLSHELPFGLKNTSKIVTFHDLIWEIYPEQFGWINSSIYRTKYKNSANRADHVVCVSKSTAKDLNHFYHIPIDKISVVYQSCNEAFFRLPQVRDTVRKHFLYVGSIISRKGLATIIEAYALLPKQDQSPFVVIGKVQGSYAERCLMRIEDLGLKDHFKFIGDVPNQALVKYYDEAVALVYPSIYEGFGIPLLEARTRQCPIITSKLSALPEAGGPNAILIDPKDIKEIAHAMQKVIYHDKANSEQIPCEFTPEGGAEKMMACYEKVLSSKT